MIEYKLEKCMVKRDDPARGGVRITTKVLAKISNRKPEFDYELLVINEALLKHGGIVATPLSIFKELYADEGKLGVLFGVELDTLETSHKDVTDYFNYALTHLER